MWLPKPVCSLSVVSSRCGGEKLILSAVSCPWLFPLINLFLAFLFGLSIKVEVAQYLKTYRRSTAGSSHIPSIILYIPFLISRIGADFSWLTYTWSNNILVGGWGPRMKMNDVLNPIQIFFDDWMYHIIDKISLIHEIKMQEIVKSKLLFYSLALPSGDTSENQSAGTENTWRFEVSKNQAPIMLAAGKMPGCSLLLSVCLPSIIQFERHWPSQRDLGPSPANTHSGVQWQVIPQTLCNCRSAITMQKCLKDHTIR